MLKIKKTLWEVNKNSNLFKILALTKLIIFSRFSEQYNWLKIIQQANHNKKKHIKLVIRSNSQFLLISQITFKML